MEKIFNTLSESLFRKIQAKENLIISFSGENSQFIRFNNATIRQTGLVDDAEIMEELFREAHRAGGARGHVRGTLPTSGRWFTSYVAAPRGATRRRN